MLVTAAAAHGQALPARSGKPIVLDQTCQAGLRRFCPELDGTGRVRDQAICLRPYRLSLTLPCRRALTGLESRNGLRPPF